MKKAKELKNKLARWSQRPGARAIIGLLALGLTYLFASWAIDSGSLLDYAIGLVALIFGLREWALAIFTHETKGTN